MKRNSKLLALLLVAVLIGSLLAACGGSGGSSDNDAVLAGEKVDKGQNSEEGGTQTSDGTVTLPLTQEPITFTYWVPFGGTSKEVITDLSHNLVYQELEKLTNVKIEFVHPAEGQEVEQFNLMVASGDLPDIIEQGERYKGGIDRAIADGIYIRLNELVDKYAPNYKKAIESNPQLKKEVYTDQGNLSGFGMVTSDVYGTPDNPVPLDVAKENSWTGPFIRKDWLDELGLPIPSAVDEWYTALKAFKEQKNAEVPILFMYHPNGIDTTAGTFVSAFDIGPGFYLDTKDNKVKYGPIEAGFKEYLTMINKWYSEGLIDPDFPTRDNKSSQALYMDGKVGAVLQEGTGLVLKARAVNVEFAGAPYPKKDASSDIHWRYTNPLCRANYGVITSACKNPELAVKWFDYHYTEDGFKLCNFGPEGKTYDGLDEKGRPKYLEHIEIDGNEYPLAKDNYQGFDRINMVFRLHNGPYLKSDLRSNPRRWMEDLESYRVTWENQPDDYVLPPITMTDQEGAEYASIMSDVDTYKDQMILKFIMGTEPLSSFDKYVEQIKSLGIDKAIAIQEAALKRYNER
ncbi:extracellular solute-binding protein [Mahella australiensis]|uniref:Extracellular solute-binding protein family 1 n=1 Tax=Mahella australiensis (strain DSM 15567 / CIP 107919 / 50-1 BON) TaxID=697281 RepID=F3ZZN9_MAHA5|nr:extracellular solute-binding protein [Mahella australiensis]AEE96865.1 extracellular solute-binding protein family 1 [Mahella australiensis 50-1 BON]